MMRRCKIQLVAGTRPNVMKIAPLYLALKQQNWCEPQIVFLEQHNSVNMGADLFRQFGVNDDILRLTLSGNDLGTRLGSIISAYWNEADISKPDLVVVPGDVDVSLGSAIAAKRLALPVAHLEAGLRSHDSRMPEELNRIMIDSISDILLAPSEAAAENLIYHEGHERKSVHLVGNVMIDSIEAARDQEVSVALRKRFNLNDKFGVATFHRPSNVDDPVTLQNIVNLIGRASANMPLVFSVHPRTRSRLSESQMQELRGHANLIVTEPLSYHEFINLVAMSQYVMTDSGGIQEETSYLGVPCLTLRETTERPITTIIGTNVLVSFADVDFHLARAKREPAAISRIPLWDGRAAHRCAHIFNVWWSSQGHRRSDGQ